MKNRIRLWTVIVISLFLMVTGLVGIDEGPSGSGTPAGQSVQVSDVPWATDLPASVFPSGVPRSRSEVNVLLLNEILTGGYPIERIKIYIDPPQAGSVDYGRRCNILVNSVWDTSKYIYPDRPLPDDPKQLLENPVILWRLKHLEPVGPATRDTLVKIVNGRPSAYEAMERYELEDGMRLKPGQFMIVKDVSYPDISSNSPALVVCHPGGTETVRAYSTIAWLATREEVEQDRWAPFQRDMYWAMIERNILDGVAIYYFETGGKMPKSRKDFEEVLGPENPKAWNPAVEVFVEEMIPKLTPAMFRPMEEWRAILETLRREWGS